MAFSDQEKARIRYFLSYPSWSKYAQSITLGIPAGAQPLFILEGAFDRLLPGGEEAARNCLCECESTERQISESRSRMRVKKIGNIELNGNEARDLRREMLWWMYRLADSLGCAQNPYAQLVFNGLQNMGGINANVVG